MNRYLNIVNTFRIRGGLACIESYRHIALENSEVKYIQIKLTHYFVVFKVILPLKIRKNQERLSLFFVFENQKAGTVPLLKDSWLV